MLLFMTLSGAALIVLLLLLRAILKNRVHRTVWLVLWAVAVLRLLVPVSVTSPTSLYNFQPFQRMSAAAAAQSAEGQALASASEQPTGQTRFVKAQEPSAASVCSDTLLTCVWLAGAAILLLIFAVSHIRSRSAYRKAIPIKAPACLPAHIRLRVLDDVGAPLTYGIFRPVILLPSELIADEAGMERVLRHELSHIRHFDILYKAVLLLTVVVHWFNPLVWVMFFAASQDMEMRADADAVAAAGSHEKYAYAKLLVAAEVHKCGGYLKTGFSRSSTERRMKALINGKPNKAASLVSGVMIAALMVFVFAASPMPVQAEQSPESAAAVQPVGQTTPDGQMPEEQKAPDKQVSETTDESEIPDSPAEETKKETEMPAQQTAEPVRAEDPLPQAAAAASTQQQTPVSEQPVGSNEPEAEQQLPAPATESAQITLPPVTSPVLDLAGTGTAAPAYPLMGEEPNASGETEAP